MKKIMVAMAITVSSFYGMAQVNPSANPVGAVFAREGGEMPDGVFRLTCGGYEVFTLASSDKAFQPASLYYGKNGEDKERVDALAPDGKVPTAMNCFLVKTPAGYIMFDTGLPESKGGKTLERLAAISVGSDEVKAVYLTHGHFDHIGGLIDEEGKAVFSEAKVYVPADELSFMRETMEEVTAQIEKAYDGRIVGFEAGEILADNVLPIRATGHTPGHTAYRLGNLLFVGDIMHGAALQMIDPTICASYDADRQQAIDTRDRVLSYAIANSLTVLGAHISLNGVIF